MATIADVAKLAGVSTGTVSRVMNGAENIHPDTRSKVEQAIAHLGYQPNFQARSLRSKRTDTIALAIPELTNYFWTTIARGVQDASQAKGYHIFICNTYPKSRQHIRYLESISSRVDGMILSRRSERVVVAPNEATSSRQTSDSREKPIVFVGQSQAANWNVDSVYSDSVSGAFALTEHLIHLGHRKIAIITGRQSSTSASDRVAGYALALADAKIPIDPQMICWGEYERKTAERLTHDLMEHLPTTTAIVAANNEIAIGVIQALEKRQVSVPDTVAVVCFDDFYPDSRFASLMTVASQSPYDIGVNAAQLLLNRLNSNDYLRPQTIVLPARLIVRQSCGGKPTTINQNMAFDNVQGQLIPPLPRQKLVTLAAEVSSMIEVALPLNDDHLLQANKAQAALVKKALRRQSVKSSPIPHFEYAITSRALYRYVLEREPDFEFIQQNVQISPEDQVEFARRSGIAAIPCRFPYHPALVHQDGIWSKDRELPLFDFPLFTDQLDFFDRYMRAARNTNVGIAADFRSIFADTLSVIDTLSKFHQDSELSLLEGVADDLLHYQSKIVQLICDRFGADLAFVLFSDHLADGHGLRVSTDAFETIFAQRIQYLIRPAQEHGLTTVLYTPGELESVIPLAQRLGFDAVYIAQADPDDFTAIKLTGNENLSYMGGIPVSALMKGTKPEQIRAMIAQLALGSGYVAGVSGEINDDVPIENFFSLLGALSVDKD
jgi:LacI family transcriptional regulator